MKSLYLNVVVIPALLVVCVLAGCVKQLDIPQGTDVISFGAAPLMSVETKAAEVTSLESFYVSAVTGPAGTETSVWNSVTFSKVAGSNPASYAGNKFWPASDENYKFYASNVPLTFSAAGTTVSASNATDVVVAYLTTGGYRTKNTLTFEHIFARVGTVTVVAEPGNLISGVSIRIVPKTGGTYNLRTGEWSGVTTGAQAPVATALGGNEPGLWLVPGEYVLYGTWTVTPAGGSPVTYTDIEVPVTLPKGKVFGLNISLGAGIQLGVDLQEYEDETYIEQLPPLTFEALGNGNILWKTNNASWVKTIEYSKDNGVTWTAIESTTSGAAIPVNTGDKVLIRGNNKAYGSTDSSYYCFFSGSVPYYVYGNISDLLVSGYKKRLDDFCFYNLFYHNNYLRSHESKKIILPATMLANDCYDGMFNGCTGLTSAPELPATTLANNCYRSMFFDCTGLTSAPELPATTLARICYEGMFYGCTGLTSAPELPATTLADYCYSNMFYGCTSLTTAPDLPATTLANYCYQYMFQYCTSLTTAPELPATTLANYCYSYMFRGCTSLTTAPELRATTLANYCYSYMFYGCSRLNYIKAFFTTKPSSAYTNNWVSGVAATGTFVKADNATWDVTGVNGVPTGWTVMRNSYLTYSLSNYTCNGTSATRINTNQRLFNTTDYPNGFRLEFSGTATIASANLPTEYGTWFGCVDESGSPWPGFVFKQQNNRDDVMYECNTAAEGQKGIYNLYGTDFDVIITYDGSTLAATVNDRSVSINGSITHNFPLSVGGGMNTETTWFSDRDGYCVINSLRVYKL